MKVKRFINVSDDEVNAFSDQEDIEVLSISAFLDDLSNINYIVVYEEVVK